MMINTQLYRRPFALTALFFLVSASRKNLFTSSTTCVIISVTNTNGTRETMSFPSGFQRGSASGCKRSTRQEVDTPRQPVPRLQGTRHDLVTGR